MVDDDDALGNFPSELVHKIIVHGAQMSTKFAYSLCLVARWTRALALPYLYSTVVLETMPQKLKYYESLKLLLSMEGSHTLSPKDQLQGLWVKPASNRMVDIFRLTDNVSHLALSTINFMWIVDHSTPSQSVRPTLSIRNIARKPDLHLLVVDNNDSNWGALFPGTIPSHISPLWKKITHLQLADVAQPFQSIDFAQLSNLTHLAIPFPRLDDGMTHSVMLRRFFRHTITYVVFIIYTDIPHPVDKIGIFRRLQPVYPQLRCVKCEKGRLQEDWEIEARGGRSIWDRAEEFTA